MFNRVPHHLKSTGNTLFWQFIEERKVGVLSWVQIYRIRCSLEIRLDYQKRKKGDLVHSKKKQSYLNVKMPLFVLACPKRSIKTYNGGCKPCVAAYLAFIRVTTPPSPPWWWWFSLKSIVNKGDAFIILCLRDAIAVKRHGLGKVR